MNMQKWFCAAMLAALFGGLFQIASANESEGKAFHSALEALQNHVDARSVLTPEQIEAQTNLLKEYQQSLGESADAIKQCHQFIASYDAKYKPLWIGHPQLNRKSKKPEDAIHWAVFWAMQLMVDHLYDNAHLKRYSDLYEGLRFGTADYFPGAVEQMVDSDVVHTVKINGSYPDTWGHPVFQEERPARKPTGSYLVPGSIAIVSVPQSLVNQGYQVRVGAHSWDLEKKPRVKRLYRCTTVFDIDSTEVKVANPLGGAIYIEVPYQADAGVVSISIRNATRSPFFAMLPFHQTSLKEWRDEQRNLKAPWTDFQTEKFMVQVPTSWIYRFDDPASLLKEWDKSMDVVNDLMGLPRLHGRETLYTQVDTQLRGRAFHPGYPSGNRGYVPTKDYGGDYTENHLLSGPRQAISYEFHEMGHGFLFPKYPGDRESAVNLHHVAVMNLMHGMDLDEAFRSSRGTGNDHSTLETTAVSWMMSDSFVEQRGMPGIERQYQLKGHAKFVDVARLFGWESLQKFWRSTQQDHEDGKPWELNVSDTDKYTQRMSESAGADLRPLIHFWGILPQDDAVSDDAMEKAGISPSLKVYDTLVRYQQLIPKGQTEFRDHALKWWGRQPTEKGYTTERNHAARWGHYDENEAAKANRVMQQIIARYFPDGRPSH